MTDPEATPTPPGPRDPIWRPFYIVGFLLVAAVALNVHTGNLLWRNYTLIGCGIFLFIAGLVRHTTWRPPRIALYMAGVTAALHYMGGSLAGLHQVGGINGLYHAFPWWDNVTHALGAAAASVTGIAAAARRTTPRPDGKPRLAYLLLIGVALAALGGILVELYEFGGFVFFGTLDQGFYTNTVLDLYYNSLGALIAGFGYVRHGLPRDLS